MHWKIFNFLLCLTNIQHYLSSINAFSQFFQVKPTVRWALDACKFQDTIFALIPTNKYYCPY